MKFDTFLKGIIFFIEIPIILICIGRWCSFIYKFDLLGNLFVSFGVMLGIVISVSFGVGIIVARF
jgi:hypothetical protein